MVGRQPERSKNPSFVGGAACLDFVNTVAWRGTWRERDDLLSYTDLVTWCREAGLLGASEARALAASARRSPASAHRALDRVLKARDSLHGLFMAARSR